MKKSRTAGPSRVVASPTVRSLPLVDVLVDTKAALFELMMQSGEPYRVSRRLDSLNQATLACS